MKSDLTLDTSDAESKQNMNLIILQSNMDEVWFCCCCLGKTKHKITVEKLLFKRLGLVRFFIFLKSLMLTMVSLFDKNTVNTVILWNIITIWNNCFLFEYFLNVIYSCDGKAELSSCELVTWSFRNHYNMLIWWSRNILIIIIDEHSCDV